MSQKDNNCSVSISAGVDSPCYMNPLRTTAAVDFWAFYYYYFNLEEV